MKQLPKGSIGIFIGVLLCLVMASFLGDQFSRSALANQQASIAERQATIQARSLTALVEAGLQNDPPAPLQTLVSDYEARLDGIVSQIRILRLNGALLLASTRPGDVADQRLAREEKPFFDLVKELKSGIETNHDEGVFRKRELAVDPMADKSHLLLTLPYYQGEVLEGAVQLVYQPQPLKVVEKTNNYLIATVGLGLLVLLAWFGGARLKFEHPRILVGLLCLPLLFGLGASVSGRIASFTEGRKGIESALAQHLADQRVLVTQLAKERAINFVPPEQNSWDCDTYRRPYGFFEVAGTLHPEAIEAALDDAIQPLRKALWGNVALGLALFLLFGLGIAGHVGKTIWTHRGAYGYVSPALAGMTLLVFFPFIYGLALSFTSQTLYNTDKPLLDIWAGLGNYVDILADLRVATQVNGQWVLNYQNFYWTAFITIAWTVTNVTIGVSVGLGLSLCLNSPTMRFKPIYRSILILPWALPTYVTALIWKGLFHKQFGPINQIIQIFGGQSFSWFDHVFTSFITGVTVNGWLSFPFMMLICLGGLQSISADMYEAARLDGASRFQQFRYITLPSLKPTLIPAIIISVVWTFNLFNVIYLVSGGEPGGANEILVTQAYKIAFEKYQYGYAAAYSVVIFGILLIYGVFQNKMSRATEDIRT